MRFTLLGVILGGFFAAPPLAGAGAEGPQLPGKPPAYFQYLGDRGLSTVPNAQAIVPRFWAPGLDDDYTPQGLAVAGGQVHMVGYGPGGCKLFSLSTTDGTQRAPLDIPACKHGGGLAALGDGRFVLIDTRALFVIENGAVRHRITLAKPLNGSFGDFDGADLWIGSYERDQPGRIWRIPLSALTKDAIAESDATASAPIPQRAQGMAFAHRSLWLTFSGSSFGRIARIDPGTGQEIKSYAMPAGIEDIGVADDGLIWAVSEAGAKKYIGWNTIYPLIFTIDPAKLK